MTHQDVIKLHPRPSSLDREAALRSIEECLDCAATCTACADDSLHGFLPSRGMCTDNAAMVAAAGWRRLRDDGPTPLDAGADPNLLLPVVP